MNFERAYYAEDREHLLGLHELNYGLRPLRPVDALEGVLCMLGYEVTTGPLPAGLWAQVQGDVVTVADDLAARCAYQKVDLDGVRASSLAHELGHIRLHPDHLCRLEDLHAELERQADLYAAVFLVPWRLLQARPQFVMLLDAQQAGREVEQRWLWRQVGDLARWFGVTATLMRRFLVELQVCEYDYEVRRLRIRGGIHVDS